MSIKKRGQISTEFLFSIAIIFLIFLFILFFTYEKSRDTNEKNIELKLRNECIKFSNIVSDVYSSNSGTLVNTKTTHNVSIFDDKRIVVKYEGVEVPCTYSGYAHDKNFTGNIKIKNENGVIVIE